MRFEDILEGTELPEFVFPVTASAIAVGAIATNDYETVHHDKAAAEASGVPNIFMNILTTNGLVQRFVGEWGAGRQDPKDQDQAGRAKLCGRHHADQRQSQPCQYGRR